MGCPVVIIYNPGSGRPRERLKALSAMVKTLDRRGIRAEVHATAGPGDATRLAHDAVAGGSRMIVVHGGDGTVNEAMQPVVGSPTSFAVWPGGTANVLARELGLPREVERVAEMIASGHVRRVAVGRAGVRYFLSMAGVGVDAAIVRAVNPRLKRVLGEGAYWIAALGQLACWRPDRFLVRVGDRAYDATFAVVARVASYGGGLRIVPRARIESDHFDLCLFDWTERRRFLRALPAAYSGRHLAFPGVTYLTAPRASAYGAEGAWVHVDGELLGPLPMTFECVPASLSLVGT